MFQEKTAESSVPGCKGGLGLAAAVPRMETSVSAYAQRTGCFWLAFWGFKLCYDCGVIPRYPTGWKVTDATRTWKISLLQGPRSLAPAPHPAHLKAPLASKITYDCSPRRHSPPQRYVSRQSARWGPLWLSWWQGSLSIGFRYVTDPLPTPRSFGLKEAIFEILSLECLIWLQGKQ